MFWLCRFQTESDENVISGTLLAVPVLIRDYVDAFLQVIFWGTLALMGVCYTFISKKVYESYKASKSRSQSASRRTKAKVFVVVGVFFICFAPFHFARVPYTLTQTRITTSHCQAQNALYIAKETTLWLSATNVCLDPLIYVFLCKVFRKRLTTTFCKVTMESPTATSTQLEMSKVDHSTRLSYNGMAQMEQVTIRQS